MSRQVKPQLWILGSSIGTGVPGVRPPPTVHVGPKGQAQILLFEIAGLSALYPSMSHNLPMPLFLRVRNDNHGNARI